MDEDAPLALQMTYRGPLLRREPNGKYYNGWATLFCRGIFPCPAGRSFRTTRGPDL
jgi:hypothetical protein